jgi:hypothetical protein
MKSSDFNLERPGNADVPVGSSLLKADEDVGVPGSAGPQYGREDNFMRRGYQDDENKRATNLKTALGPIEHKAGSP